MTGIPRAGPLSESDPGAIPCRSLVPPRPRFPSTWPPQTAWEAGPSRVGGLHTRAFLPGASVMPVTNQDGGLPGPSSELDAGMAASGPGSLWTSEGPGADKGLQARPSESLRLAPLRPQLHCGWLRPPTAPRLPLQQDCSPAAGAARLWHARHVQSLLPCGHPRGTASLGPSGFQLPTGSSPGSSMHLPADTLAGPAPLQVPHAWASPPGHCSNPAAPLGRPVAHIACLPPSTLLCRAFLAYWV